MTGMGYFQSSNHPRRISNRTRARGANPYQHRPTSTPTSPRSYRYERVSQLSMVEQRGSLSIDPLGFVNGANLYWYVANRAPDLEDPSGLEWKVWRVNSRAKARATPCGEEGNTIHELATKIKLDTGEWQEWLTFNGSIVGGPIKVRRDGKVLLVDMDSVDVNQDEICQVVQVPNTIVVGWGGDLAIIGGKIVTSYPWGKYILKDVGFKIVECNLKKKCTPAKFTSHVNSLSRDGELHGIFFYGHGRGTKGFGPKHGGYVKYADLNLHYQLAIAWLMACGTDCMDARALVSQDGLFDGCRGIQWPFFGDQLKWTREDLLEMGSRFEDDCD
jgi:hypothetical protein